MKIRDFLAIPFWLLEGLFGRIAITIGGKWTAAMFKEQAIKIGKLYEKSE